MNEIVFNAPQSSTKVVLMMKKSLSFFDTYFIKFCWHLFKLLLLVLYSVVITSTLLGLLGIFQLWTAVLGSVGLVVFLYFLMGKANSLIRSTPAEGLDPDQIRNRSLLSLAGVIATVLLLVLILVPIWNWPMSTMQNSIHHDAGIYHFPKAVEMWKTGSAWDFTISYGDYPFGYESLLSFTMLFNRNVGVWSIPHLLIMLLMILGTWLVAIRYTRLPAGITLAGVVFLGLSGFLEIGNPWYFLRFIIYTIGKNDLFLAAATMAAMVFVPLPTDPDSSTDWVGLGISSGLAISIKPNCAPILLFLWLYAIITSIIRKDSLWPALPGILLAVLGTGWVIRNYIGIGQLFLSDSLHVIRDSIWFNLTNPEFYRHFPTSLLFSILMVFVTLLGSLWKKTRLSLIDALLLFVILISFMITPVSVVRAHDPSAIGWRFGITLLFLQFVYLLAVLEPITKLILDWITKSWFFTWLAAVLLLGTSILFFDMQKDILEVLPERANILVRSYQDDQADYPSVFDYLDEHISHSTVWVEGDLNFYGYDPAFTNSTTRSKPADYIVVVDQSLDDLWFDSTKWDLIYQDAQGYILRNPALGSN